MRREAWSGIFAAFVVAATAGVAAQTSPPSQNSPEPTPPPTTQAPATSAPQSSEGSRITVAGCLEAAPSGPVGTSGSAAPAPSAATAAAPAEATSGQAKLVLAKAVPSPAAADASNSATPRTYRLIANEASLNPHIGKKVELSGTVEDSSAESGPTLRVEAGKVVAAACTE